MKIMAVVARKTLTKIAKKSMDRTQVIQRRGRRGMVRRVIEHCCDLFHFDRTCPNRAVDLLIILHLRFTIPYRDTSSGTLSETPSLT
jgi:hypothetical protein